MKPNPLKQGVLTENSQGIGTVTRKMVHQRAVELAVINGRSAQDVSKADWEQAKLELTGGPDATPREVPGSTGHKVEAAAGEDEDEEGRSDNEKLVDEGMGEAELDQRNQADKK